MRKQFLSQQQFLPSPCSPSVFILVRRRGRRGEGEECLVGKYLKGKDTHTHTRACKYTRLAGTVGVYRGGGRSCFFLAARVSPRNGLESSKRAVEQDTGITRRIGPQTCPDPSSALLFVVKKKRKKEFPVEREREREGGRLTWRSDEIPSVKT